MRQLDEIIAICQKLKAEGKQPSTGLIKAQLPNKTPLPTIIAGLNAYKQDPNKKVAMPESRKDPASSDLPDAVQKIQALESRVITLEKQITLLVSELAQLKKK